MTFKSTLPDFLEVWRDWMGCNSTEGGGVMVEDRRFSTHGLVSLCHL